ncbi:UNVERIFIED_CONTAM: hypothetical protein Sradi_1565400 [Sesamum radiatum]|uniref:Uncharacterized protein n=1 Tax=Sesamum radiatum TaxID=300843 RepID=A0AAW2U9R1_SESRA
MTWHATHETEEGLMCHPSDAEAWKHFGQMYPDFAEEPHNVRLGLCADGFGPHGQYGRTYSSRPISITPYNLHLLWHVGVRTYDHATDNEFIMQAVLMWIVNDLLAYGMAYHWGYGMSDLNKKAFTKNRVENKVAHPRLSGDQLLDGVADICPAVEMSLSLPKG